MSALAVKSIAYGFPAAAANQPTTPCMPDGDQAAVLSAAVTDTEARGGLGLGSPSRDGGSHAGN